MVGTYVLCHIWKSNTGKEAPGMMEQQNVLMKPENQRFFVWTTKGLKLTGNPPREVVEAWLTLANVPKRKPMLAFVRRALM
jgi:hypothetical protein